MQPTQGHVRSLLPVMVGQFIGPVGRGDINLNYHQFRLIVQFERLDVLILNSDVIIVVQVSGQRSQS